MVFTFRTSVGANHIKENKMPITVDGNYIQQVIEAIKQLPVNCNDFDAADRWVGIVMVLQNMLQTEVPETEAQTNLEEE